MKLKIYTNIEWFNYTVRPVEKYDQSWIKISAIS